MKNLDRRIPGILGKLAGFFAVIVLLGVSGYSQTTTSQLKKHVGYLADDKLEGRYIGTEGCRMAADYIKQYFATIGLKSFNGDYFQHFEVSDAGACGNNSEFGINTLLERPGLPREDWKKIKKKLTAGTDWKMLQFSGEGNLHDLPVAFVGYGVTDPETGYDDYAGIDVAGKAVLVISDSMLNGGSKYNFLDAHSSVTEKISNATAHNAAAIILVKRQSDSANLFYDTSIMSTGAKFGIPVIQVTRTAAGKLFPKNKFLIDFERNINTTQKPQSFILSEITLEMKIEIDKKMMKLMNVMGYVEGTDPQLKNEYVVVGGHYDHIGYGNGYSSYRGKEKMIHNGADDNASGASTVMELAAIIAKNPLKRSVIFISFTGEEAGLLGSAYFVKNMPIDAKNVVAMLNFDMVGRLRNKEISIMGVGTSSIFQPIVEKYATEYGLKVTEMSDGFTPSDQTSFYAAGIPVLMFFTGLHADYHAPGDDAEKINYDGMTEILNYGNAILKDVANAAERPDYNKKSLDEMMEKMKNAPRTEHGGGGVYFGIVPNFGENPDGFEISGTSDNSPAQKAGLKTGDVITMFGAKPIKNLYDLTYALRESKPGDKVTIEYIRAGKKMKVDVTLEKR